MNVFLADCVTWEPIPPAQLGYELPEPGYPDKVLSFTDPISGVVTKDVAASNNVVEESADYRKESFIQIYDNDWWGSKESKSGGGSELKQTGNVVKVLDKLVQKLKKLLGKQVIR